MIYTVTFNPCLDYIIQVDGLKLGLVNRTAHEEMLPGGKGVNVSIVLRNLGHENRALGFLAGFTGAEIACRLRETGVEADFIEVAEGMSRINVKINSDGVETEVNGMGPAIQPADVEALYAKLDELTAGDTLIISGSVPSVLPGDIYERIMARLEGRGVSIVVDATRDLLVNVLPYHPLPHQAEQPRARRDLRRGAPHSRRGRALGAEVAGARGRATFLSPWRARARCSWPRTARCTRARRRAVMW